METCIHCESDRIANVTAKCSDMCSIRTNGGEHDGYVPDKMAIGEGDYVEFSYCLDCLRIQANGPLPHCAAEGKRVKRKPLPPTDKAAPEVALIEARFGGTCRCGSRFARGDEIRYSYVAARALECPVCRPKVRA